MQVLPTELGSSGIKRWDGSIQPLNSAAPAVPPTPADAHEFSYTIDHHTEAKRFDPDGNYVRRWLPVLARLPAKYIHEPWNAPESVLADAGACVGVGQEGWRRRGRRVKMGGRGHRDGAHDIVTTCGRWGAVWRKAWGCCAFNSAAVSEGAWLPSPTVPTQPSPASPSLPAHPALPPTCRH